jgi:diguanylate cyclase (GGDEF)-like protein/PAS domain S-box-containing protein
MRQANARVRIKQFLSPPVFEDEEKTRRAGLVNGVLLVIAAGASLFLFASAIASVANWLIIQLSLIMFLITIILKLLLNLSYVRLAGTLLSLAVWTIFTIPIFIFDGLRDTAVTGYFLAIIITSLVLSGNTLTLFMSLASLSITMAYWTEINGYLVTSLGIPPSPIDLATMLITLNTTALLVGLTVRRIVRDERSIVAERNKAQRYLGIAGTLILALDADGRVSLINKRGCEALGYQQDEVIGQHWFDHFVPASVRERANANFARLLSGEIESLEHSENYILTKAGEERIIAWHNSLLHDDQGKIIGTLSSGEDITEQLRAAREIERRRQYLEGVLAAAPDAIVTMDASQKIVEWNRGAERLFMYTRAEVIGQKIDDLITTADLVAESVKFTEIVMAGNEIPPAETIRFRKDGTAVNVILAASPILVDGEFVGAVAVYTDISERKQMEEQLAYLATHDPLTGLPNRALFRDRLDRALERSKRHQNEKVAKWEIGVLMIDLDNFKTINDTLGHATGDHLLKAIAKRLEKRIRRCDTVARMGGDEFTLIFENLNGRRDAVLLAEKVLEVFSKPFALGEHTMMVEASIGFSLYPQDGTEVEELFKCADKAMYAAKLSGNAYCSYSQMRFDADGEQVEEDGRQGK